jgi:putative transposase
VRFHFVARHRRLFPIDRMCRVLDVSRSGFYAWCRRPASDRAQQTAGVIEQIRAVHRASRQVYGSPRVYWALRRAGHAIGRHRIARLMRLEGLRGRAAQRFRYIATRHGEMPAAPNRVGQDFEPPALNHLWLADITQVRTREGWLFLAVLLDACSRRIVGWATASRPAQALALDALYQALRLRRPPQGLVHHSDRGGPYACAEYQDVLDRHGIVGSMSRPGNCYDNAPVESFFHSLKTEWLYHLTLSSRLQARTAIFEYIEAFYNRSRLHSSLSYRSPDEYETVTVTA